jgi:two-component system C4-dicarboxylate transport response regulator DctD
VADRVLLVTAEEGLARLGASALAGGEMFFERDAAPAIAACEHARPDVVVWDGEVVGDDGAPPVARLRGSGAGVVVIVGPGDTPAGVRALRDGAEQFLEKPVSADHLTVAVARAAEAARWRRAALRSSEAEPTAAERPYRPRTLDEVEREQIERALRHHGGNRTRAARELGISRATLINKIKGYALDL